MAVLAEGDFQAARALGLVSTRRMRREDAEAVLALLAERDRDARMVAWAHAEAAYLQAFAYGEAEPINFEEAVALKEGRACLVDPHWDARRALRREQERGREWQAERDRQDRETLAMAREYAERSWARMREEVAAMYEARAKAKKRRNTHTGARPGVPEGGRTPTERRDAGMLDTAVLEAITDVLTKMRPDLLDVQGVGVGRHNAVTFFYDGKGDRVGWSAYLGAGVTVVGDAWGERVLVGNASPRDVSVGALKVAAPEYSVTWARRGWLGGWIVWTRDAQGESRRALDATRRERERREQVTVTRERVLPPCKMDAHEACDGDTEDREWRQSVRVWCSCPCHADVAEAV